MQRIRNMIKDRISNDSGFVIAVVYVMFLVMMISLVGLSININNNSKYTSMTVANDTAYFFAEYGMEKVQDQINEIIWSGGKDASADKRECYAKEGLCEEGGLTGTQQLIFDLNTKIQDSSFFYDDIYIEPNSPVRTNRRSKNLVSLKAKIWKEPDDADGNSPLNPYVVIVTAEVDDRARGIDSSDPTEYKNVTSVSKLGARITKSTKFIDEENKEIDTTKLQEVLFSSVVEVKKDNVYEKGE